jgi:pimeloyl-ACP methyl ester carboxylesterase
MQEFVRSPDGTSIAYERQGSGQPLVVVHGALRGRVSMVPLAEHLAPSFDVVTYDRRGRGESGDSPPYEVNREVEDLAAILELFTQPVDVFAHSSGGVLAIDGVLDDLPIQRLAVYEPPYFDVDDPTRPSVDFPDRLAQLLSQSDRDGALRLFLREGPAIPDAAIDELSRSPVWEGWLEVAHTTPYDARLVGRGDFPKALGGIDIPVIVMVGEASDRRTQESANALARLLPRGQLVVLPGQTHGAHRAAPELLAGTIASLLIEGTQDLFWG